MGEIRPAASFSLPEAKFSALVAEHLVPGAQLAIHQAGETTFWETGELEADTGRRVTGDAAFPVGSVSKSFTATVAMILAADGDMDPDEPIAGYVPEVGAAGRMLTLRQLLSHTSGLADLPGMAEDLPTLRRYVAGHVHTGNFVLPPGAGFSYSTLGYALTGRLIETVTGMPWAEAVESILLRPLGIEAAFIGIPGARPARRPLATGHSANVATGRIRPVQQSGGPDIAPAGGLVLSAGDLVAFGLLHAGLGAAGLLPAASARRMRQPVPHADPFGLADGWGLGFAVYRQQAADWIGHDGNADGTACYLRISPADGWVIALTSNASTGIALWQDLLAELSRAGVPVGPPRAPAPLGVCLVPPPGCAGRYVNGDIEYEVTGDGSGHLFLSVDGGGSLPLTPYQDLTFAVTDPTSAAQPLRGRFVRGEATGEICGLQVGGRFAGRPALPHAAPGAGGYLVTAR